MRRRNTTQYAHTQAHHTHRPYQVAPNTHTHTHTLTEYVHTGSQSATTGKYAGSYTRAVNDVGSVMMAGGHLWVGMNR
jgi:hypothetical protein